MCVGGGGGDRDSTSWLLRPLAGKALTGWSRRHLVRGPVQSYVEDGGYHLIKTLRNGSK